MKHCRNCGIEVDNSFNLCPYCGQTLTTAQTATECSRQNGASVQPPTAESFERREVRTPNTVTHTSIDSPAFQTTDGRNIVFNGQIVESNTQQYYQSKLTKIIQAIFNGEPYQLSHTTFVTVFRIGEYVQRGFAEQARDVVVYGQLQNVLAAGDDVTVVARQSGNRLVAKSIVNHSSEAQVIPQGGLIAAGVIRAAVFIPLFILMLLLVALITTPSSVIVDSLLNIIWPVILIGIGIAWLKGKFKKK